MFVLKINFARLQKEKFCPISPTYYSPSCTTTQSLQNNGYGVKHTQIAAYDISISVIVMQSFWQNSKLSMRAHFSCKDFFAGTVHFLSVITAKKLSYADCLVILHSASNWQVLEGTSCSGHGNPIFLSPEMKAQA